MSFKKENELSLEKSLKEIDSILFNAQGENAFERYSKFLKKKESIENLLNEVSCIVKDHYRDSMPLSMRGKVVTAYDRGNDEDGYMIMIQERKGERYKKVLKINDVTFYTRHKDKAEEICKRFNDNCL